MPNRLAGATSPYLLQHADTPSTGPGRPRRHGCRVMGPAGESVVERPVVARGGGRTDGRRGVGRRRSASARGLARLGCEASDVDRMRAANRSGVAYRGRAAAEASARRCPLRVDVLVEARPAVAEPAAALIRESEGAALIVVGSRAHGVARATFLRSVSRSVVQRARCPAVVVRTGRATGDEKVQPSRRIAVDLVDPSAEPVRRRRTPWE